MNETTKSRRYWGEIEKTALIGRGIDIGCGPDPVTPEAVGFDKSDGDANRITQFVREQFDFVYSSHCLEHMDDPRKTILEWWQLVKPGGYLFIAVPDEDLYEQGVFPSRFGPEHKATFTISKVQSWSPKSINVLELAKSLPGGTLLSLELQDRGYDRRLLSFGKAAPGLLIRAVARFQNLLFKLASDDEQKGIRRLLAGFYSIDQTNSPFNAQAQIQLIVQKQPKTEHGI